MTSTRYAGGESAHTQPPGEWRAWCVAEDLDGEPHEGYGPVGSYLDAAAWLRAVSLVPVEITTRGRLLLVWVRRARIVPYVN